MQTTTSLYICRSCFRICDGEHPGHDHMLILCDTGNPGDERRKPVKDQFGNMVSRAPRWYLEALGYIPLEA